ncbi:long-chain-fatty-acid--coa ligase [hydrocarbon metagenome]|uniref:Long-chain-fatty-acid--coa ligase n=1 Tax=hydrocarbon metagenome TaxID=938273 RepID=A0A0W8FT37_9ZZZZ
MKEKSFFSVLLNLPRLIFMKETRGVALVAIKQLGLVTIIKILFKTVTKTGFIKSIKCVFTFKLDDLVASMFVSMWDVFGDREAIITGEKRITYRELKDRVLRLANGLQALGLKPKDRFAELLLNGNEFFEALFAGSLIGCPMPFLNWHLKGDDLAGAINRASPKILIFDEEFYDDVIAIKDKLTTVKHYVMVGAKLKDGVMLYEDLLSKSANTMPKVSIALALNPYSGGTTGAPKNVNYFDGFGYLISDTSEKPKTSLKDYLTLLVKQVSFTYWFGAHKIKDKKSANIRLLMPSPVYHAASIIGWTPLLLHGATGVAMRNFNAEELLKLIEKERIGWVFIVPTIIDRLLHLPDNVKNKYDLSSMKSLICGSAPASPELKEAANRFFKERGCKNNVFHEFYGSSETAVVTTLIPEDYEQNPKRLASVGKARCGELGIYNKEEAKWCAPNEQGYIFNRTMMTESLKYSGSPEKTKSVFEFVDGVRWFDDGLIGYMDEDGYVYLTGRVKEMIISGGVNIYPNEIERIINNHDEVTDVAVVRAPDADLGECVAAVIQLKKNSAINKEDILEHCRKNGLRGFKIPKIVEFAAELPRHIDGKLVKRELEDKFWKGIERRG